jgi:hypothetical protein
MQTHLLVLASRLPPPRDKAAFEAAFGPFYRVTQLIVSTTPASASNYTNPVSGLPSIVTDANIQLLFQMQAEVDGIEGEWWSRRGDGVAGGGCP